MRVLPRAKMGGVEMAGCNCGGLPTHDHFMGCDVIDGVYQAVYDRDDIGRVWVNWKDVARALGAGLVR